MPIRFLLNRFGDTPSNTPSSFSVKIPSSAQFSFSQTSGTLTAAQNGSLQVFGSSLDFSYTNSTARYSADYLRLEFPFKANTAIFSVTSDPKNIAWVSGNADITNAEWSLPITTSTPDALGSALGAGGMSIHLGNGLVANSSNFSISVNCGACILIVDPTRVLLSGLAGTAPNIPRPLPTQFKSTITFGTPKSIRFSYLIQSTGDKGFGVQAPVSANLDQPRNINGSRTRFSGSGIVVELQHGSQTSIAVSATSPTPKAQLTTQSYGLKNLIVGATDPENLRSVVTLDNSNVATGSITTDVDLRFVVPILPDPYAASALPPTGGTNSTNYTVRFAVTWDASQTSAVSIIFIPPPSTDALTSDASPKFFVDAFIAARGPPTLLDISTNVSQFGVGIGFADRGATRTAASTIPTVQNMMFELPWQNVNIVTLPAVQWEPVYTYDSMVTADGTAFPTPLNYNDSGNMTSFSTNSVNLVPFSPREALDLMVSNYNSDNTNTVQANFTLPFGIQARANLAHSRLISIRSPTLATVQPTFQSRGYLGGDQLSLGGSYRRAIFGNHGSPYFPGTATQLLNAVDSAGNPAHQNVTAISSSNNDVITGAFNQKFSGAAASPFVPVTRVDISGFGESMFSDWKQVSDQATDITKVEFDVLVGRTAREVIQLSSILYPFAVRVVRTITIQRLNTGIVVREDSGWRAVSDGNYQFPSDPSVTQPIVTHPGIVSGVTNVTNIRDLNNSSPVNALGIELVGIRFDCFVNIQNTVTGQVVNAGVPAHDMLGYVQKTVGPPLNATQYQSLLNQAGSLGGVIDCVVSIGNSPQRMKINQIGVGASQNLSDIEFAVAAWGAPIFPGKGEWSFLQISRLDQAPNSVGSMGVPLIRTGSPPVSTAPYRFSDPSALLTSNELTSYCLCHSSGTQRVLFPLPVITPPAPWAFRSNVAPFLADPYAMGNSTGPFPRLSDCIRFNDANYQIFISADGNLRLQLQPNSNTTSFTAANQRRVLRESQTMRSVALTADENGNPSQVTITIDTSQVIPWSFEITNLSMISEIPSMGGSNPDPHASEVTRVVGSIQSSAGSATQITQNPRFVFGPALQAVKDALSFFEKLGVVTPLSINMTNSWSIFVQMDLSIDKLGRYYPAIKAFLKKFFDKLDFSVEIVQHTDNWVAYHKYNFLMRIKIPVVGVFVVTIVGSFQYYVGTDGKTYTLQLGGGVGADLSFGPFEAFASVELLIIGMMGDHGWGVGAGVMISGHIDFKIVSVSLSVEASQMFMVTDCSPNNVPSQTKWGLTQVTVAIEIHICWIFDIDFHSNSEWRQRYNDGKCNLDINNAVNVGNPP